ncbi:MAG: DUF4271 domain-containing protein [Prolixibacteraceae bacterium]|nr:DUF4271 domain-containing protein [Prolixibacteraceae bacterium]
MSKFFQNNSEVNLDSVAYKNATDSVTILLTQTDSSHSETDTTRHNPTEYLFFKRSNSDTFRLFEEIKQHENNLPVQVRNTVNSDWLTIFFLVAFFLLVTVRVGFQNYISSLFQSVVNYSTSFRMFREKNFSFLQGAFRLDLVFYILFSVFIYQIMQFYNYVTPTSGFILFAKTTGLIITYFLVKKIIYWLVGVVFKSTFETSEFLFNLDNFNRVTGIVLFPVVTLIAYFPFGKPQFIMYFGIFATAVLYLRLLQRGAIILLKKQFSIFYLFLYLCTLEFLPLLLIYKIVGE